jgi:hypothetical protein
MAAQFTYWLDSQQRKALPKQTPEIPVKVEFTGDLE